MSSLAFSNASPFAAALPAPHVFTAYDADGDAIMTDAVTGLPITYGGPSKRSRSASLDSDSADSRPSKRSRSSSDEADYADMPPLIPANPLVMPVAPPPPPPAPKKAERAPVGVPEDEDGEGHDSAVRNLAEQMAEAVLQGEPREPPVWAVFDGADAAPPGGEAIGAGAGVAEPRSYCVSVTVSDLALRLDMRHPRVVLNFLRFVTSYNELAPEGEEIHLPCIRGHAVEDILSHESVVNPAPEFAAEVEELRALVERYSCGCPHCAPENWSDDEPDPYEDDERYARRDRW